MLDSVTLSAESYAAALAELETVGAAALAQAEAICKAGPPKATIDRARLESALKTLSRFADSKHWPVLACFDLRVADGALTARATDLDAEAMAILPANGAESFAAIVKAKALAGILAKAPKALTVTLSRDYPDAAPLVVTIGAARYTLESLNPSDFPDFPTAGAFTHATVAETGAAHDLFARTAFAMSTEQTRYYLNGAYLHAPDTSDFFGADPDGRIPLRSVATDGHRLGALDSAVRVPSDWPGVIVPRAAVIEIARLLAAKGAAPLTEIAANAGRIRVTCGDVTISTKVVDGTFPDYTRVLPACDDLARIDPASLSVALAAVAAVRDQKDGLTCVDIMGDSVQIAAKGEAGHAAHPVEGYAIDTAATLQAGFNSAYLGDVCASFKGAETIRMGQSSAGDPARFQADGDGLTVVVMPMRR